MKKKRANILEAVQQRQRNQFKREIREQLLQNCRRNNSGQNGDGEELSANNNCNVFGVQEDFQELSEQRKEELLQIIKRMKNMLENPQVVFSQFESNVELFNIIITDLRYIILLGADLVDPSFIKAVFLLMKQKLTETFPSMSEIQMNLVQQNQVEQYANCRFKLNMTMILIISEYLNQGGVISQLEKDKNWVVNQLFQWISQTKEDLKNILCLKCDQNFKSNEFERKVCLFERYFEEQKILLTIVDKNNQADMKLIISELFDLEYLSDLISILNSHLTPQSVQVFGLDIILMVGYFEVDNFMENLIYSDFFNFAKLQLFILQQYKSYTGKHRVNERQRNQLKIISNCLDILLQISQQKGGDILWEENFSQELMITFDEIQGQFLKQHFIMVVLSSARNIGQQFTINKMIQSNFLAWILKVIKERTESVCNMKIEELQDDKILESCMELLKFFYRFGEQQLENSQGQLSMNPYLLVLKYLRFQQTLMKCHQGQQLLNEIDSHDFL